MITISESCWARMLDGFAAEPRQVEQVCYFDGVPLAAGAGVVLAVTFPDAQLFPGRFAVSPAAMSQAGKHLRALGFKRLAQVHTHPGEWVGHSPWDDQRAYSQLSGAISIVLPYFGRTRPTIQDAGVHLRSAEGWRQLSPAEASTQLRLASDVFDFRTTTIRRVEHEPASVRPARRRSWWNSLAFWRH